MRIILPSDGLTKSKEDQALVKDLVNTSLKGKLTATERRDFFKKITFVEIYSFYKTRDDKIKYEYIKEIIGKPIGIKKAEARHDANQKNMLVKSKFDEFEIYNNLKERITL